MPKDFLFILLISSNADISLPTPFINPPNAPFKVIKSYFTVFRKCFRISGKILGRCRLPEIDKIRRVEKHRSVITYYTLQGKMYAKPPLQGQTI